MIARSRLAVVLFVLLAVVLAGCASTLTGHPVSGSASVGGSASAPVTAPASAGRTSSAPSTASAPVIGPAGAKVQVDVYEDLACPPCARFDPGLQIVIDKYLLTKDTSFTVYDLSFLDGTSGGNRYSSRAANATLCAAQISIHDFRMYQSALLRAQPAEGAHGRTDAELIATAQKVGITSSAFADCVHGEANASSVRATMATATKRGVSSVPAVYVNDRKVDPLDVESLSSAIAAAH